ncbi:hypothetical protein BDR03DRAFT_966878 [Suillus americanus]|nr:hypothetical protein BDR03DRAFT_966878 [Suillus americanus]
MFVQTRSVFRPCCCPRCLFYNHSCIFPNTCLSTAFRVPFLLSVLYSHTCMETSS